MNIALIAAAALAAITPTTKFGDVDGQATLQNVAEGANLATKTYVTNEVAKASGAKKGKYPLFLIDLNPGETRLWTGIELKASTNNFTNLNFFTSTYANETTSSEVTYDWCRVYLLSKRANTDIRKWQRVKNTSFNDTGYAPLCVAIIVDPDMFKRSQTLTSGDFLEEANDDLVWSYVRIGLTSSEKDQDGQSAWRPAMPVRWYEELPSWAKQESVVPNSENVTPYVAPWGQDYQSLLQRVQSLESQLQGLNNALHVINTGTNLVEGI